MEKEEPIFLRPNFEGTIEKRRCVYKKEKTESARKDVEEYIKSMISLICTGNKKTDQ
jgi:excinuclease UvrABC ATPase subunit